jgi:hypothetical protein
MTDAPERYLIFKRGRGYYREGSKGYTDQPFLAGRYTEDEAKAITHPNGPDGPRDGMQYFAESRFSGDEVTQRANAMVAAALEEAVATVRGLLWDDPIDECERVRNRALTSAEAKVRALIPDAGAALDRALEKAREEGRREGQIKAGAAFATSGAEERWVEDMENACPACGGSGHKDDAAHTPERQLATDILAELVRARAKFPGKNVTFAALVEEVGELATAIFEESAERVRKEAVQVAVMAMRVVLDGDHAYEPWRWEKGLDPLDPAIRARADCPDKSPDGEVEADA